MSGRALKFTIFLSILFSIISFWDHPLLSYSKEFVVLIHEICHAVAALVSGGDVKHILIHGNESGETVATLPDTKGAFLFIVSAGYLGTAMIGGFLLYKGFRGENTKTTLIIFGIVVFLITMKYAEKGSLTFQIGAIGSLATIVSSFLGRHVSSLALVFIGTSLCLYSIYDLSDFTENVHNTDAGILAYYLTGYNPNQSDRIPPSVLFLGHLIGITWSLISLGVIYKFLLHSISDPGTPLPDSLEPIGFEGGIQPGMDLNQLESLFPGELTPEVVDWFLAKGLDFHGNPILPPERELIDGFTKDSEMS